MSCPKETAWKYCFDVQVMRRNNVQFEYGGIEYFVEGADTDIESMMKTGCEITIESKYRFDPRLDTLLKEKLGICEAARRLNLPQQTLGNWVRKRDEIGLKPVKQYSTASAAEAEISRLKRELAEAKMERDILKKATAYFAKESR